MKRFAMACIAAMAVLFLSSATVAIVGPVLRVARHVPMTDLTFAGRLVSQQFGPKDEKGHAPVVYRYRVDRVLKGDYPIGSTIDMNDPRDVQVPNGYDLVLARKEGESYTFLWQCCTMPVAEREYTPYKQSPDVQLNLRWEVLNSLKDSSHWVVYKALEQTAVLSREDLVRYVKPLTKSSDPNICALAFASFVAAGMDDMIEPALEYALRQPERADKLDFYLWALLREMRQFKVKPEHLPMLAEKGLKSKSGKIREVVSYMLRESGSRSVLKHLKSLLDDPEADVRYNAAVGLAKITGDYGCSTPEDRPSGEKGAGLIQYWKNKPVE